MQTNSTAPVPVVAQKTRLVDTTVVITDLARRWDWSRPQSVERFAGRCAGHARARGPHGILIREVDKHATNLCDSSRPLEKQHAVASIIP